MNDNMKPERQSYPERFIALPKVVQDLIVANPEYGNADCLTRQGLLALATLGKDAWNAWRECFPVLDRSDLKAENGINNVDFSGEDFRGRNISFSGFKFGDRARLDETKWDDYSSFDATEWGQCSNFTGAEWGSNTRFNGAIWGDGAVFENAQWAEKCDFTGVNWGDDCDFTGANWGDGCNFSGANWGENVSFDKSVWGNACNFECASWGEQAHFIQCFWGDSASFSFARFGEMTNFQGSCWNGLTFFNGAQFCGDVCFQCTEWRGDTFFRGLSWEQGRSHCRDKNGKFDQALFEKNNGLAEELGAAPDAFLSVHFNGARFFGKVDFSNRRFLQKTSFATVSFDPVRQRVKRNQNGNPEFDNRKLVWELDPDKRRNTIFTEPPIFHGCDLGQYISFDDAKFPDPKGNNDLGRSYCTLKLVFSNFQVIREEQRFFRLEMAEETKREKGVKGGLFWAYEKFSDYGFSIRRPLLTLLAAMLFFGFLYAAMDNTTQLCLFTDPACQPPFHAMQFSLAQLPGMDKLFADSARSPKVDGWWELGLTALVITHKTVILAALFLIGLALRNLFRLK